MSKISVFLLALLLCGCTIVVQPHAAATPTSTEEALPSVFLPAPAASPDVQATAEAIWQAMPATATAKAELTRAAQPTPTATPILAPSAVPTFLAEGYPDVDRWFFIQSQQVRIHFQLSRNGDYDVQAFPATKPQEGDIEWTLCEFQTFKWELGYERPTAWKRAQVLLGCEIEQESLDELARENWLRQHQWHEIGNLYDYFEAPPTVTPTK